MFMAPEIQGKSDHDFHRITAESPGQADLYSIAQLAKFLLSGSTEYSADDLEGSCSDEMREFLGKIESDNPVERTGADPLLRLSVFEGERLKR